MTCWTDGHIRGSVPVEMLCALPVHWYVYTSSGSLYSSRFLSPQPLRSLTFLGPNTTCRLKFPRSDATLPSILSLPFLITASFPSSHQPPTTVAPLVSLNQTTPRSPSLENNSWDPVRYHCGSQNVFHLQHQSMENIEIALFGPKLSP